MKKRKTLDPKKIKKYEKDDLIIKNDSVYCNLCLKYINIEKENRFDNSRITSHISFKKHSCLSLDKEKSVLLEFLKKDGDDNNFSKDLMELIIKINIPFSIVENQYFIQFFNKYIPKNLPNRWKISEYSKDLNYDNIQKIINIVKNHEIYFIFDDTTDRFGRIVLNILVGILNGEYCCPYLLQTSFLENKNNLTLQLEILKASTILFGDQKYYKQIVFIISDQGSSNLASIRELKKTKFPKLKHVTCLCHALHSTCDFIFENHLLVKKMIFLFQKILRKKKVKILFLEYFKKTPPKPISIRWGSLLNCSNFYLENFDEIRKLVDNLNETDSKILKIKELFNQKKLFDELYDIHNYLFLSASIKQLETQGLSVEQQIKIIDDAKLGLPENFLNKLKKSLISHGSDAPEIIHLKKKI